MSNSNEMPVAPAGASAGSSANDAKNEQVSTGASASSASEHKSSGVAGTSGSGASFSAAGSTSASGSSAANTSSSGFGAHSASSSDSSTGASFAAPKPEDAVNIGSSTPAGTGSTGTGSTGTSSSGASFNQANTQAQAKFAPQTNNQKKAKKQGGFGKAFAGGIVGAIVAILVFVCLWQFTPLFGTKSATVSSSGGTITINGDTEATTAEAVGAKDLSSVVTIYVYSSSSSDWSQLFNNNSSSNSNSPSALGSGVIVKKDDTYSYIVTNFHVVENTSRAVVSVGDTQVEAESVGYDAKSDLAVIKIKKTDTTVADWGDSSNLHVGQWVAAIGSPYGYEQTLTTGIVSALYRSDVLSSSSSSLGGTTVYTDMIQTDAAINPGNSGGGLFDAEGKLIGINTYISSTSQSSAGLGFAIPQASAQSIVDTIISGQTVTHAFLGVALGASSTNPTGATVGAVYKDTAAATAGLKTGDIITKIDDKSMTSANDVTKAVAAKKVGDEITITYVRNGQEATTKAKLGDDTGSHTEYADGGAPATSNNNSGSGNSNNYNFGNSGSGNSGSGNSGSGNSGSGKNGNSGSGGSLFDYLWGNTN